MQATGIDPGRAPGDDGDLGGHPQDDRVELGPGLMGLLLGIVERAEDAHLAGPDPIEVEQHGAATSGPARQPRPASSAPAT